MIAVLITIAAALPALAGFFILWRHAADKHVYLAAALIVLTVLLWLRERFVGALRDFLGVAGPYIPWKRTSAAVPKPVNDQ